MIDYKYFGTTGTATAPYDLNRTATHEIGHWLNLRHIWGGDSGTCIGTDSIGDTPNQADNSSGFPTFPLTDSCSPTFPGVMFVNYMDYSNDAALTMFTVGQAARMENAMFSWRSSLLTSIGCQASTSGIDEINEEEVSIFPTPNNGTFNIQFQMNKIPISITIYDLIGRKVFSQINNFTSLINVSSLSPYIYLVVINFNNKTITKKLVVQ